MVENGEFVWEISSGDALGNEPYGEGTCYTFHPWYEGLILIKFIKLNIFTHCIITEDEDTIAELRNKREKGGNKTWQ